MLRIFLLYISSILILTAICPPQIASSPQGLTLIQPIQTSYFQSSNLPAFAIPSVQNINNSPSPSSIAPSVDLSPLQNLLQNSNMQQNKVSGVGNKIDGKNNSVLGDLNNIIGVLNTIQGSQNLLSGDENSIWGIGNKVVGLLNNLVGNDNRNMGEHNNLIGSTNYVIGGGNQALGNSNNVIGQNNYAWGINNVIQGTKNMATGANNLIIGDSAVIKGSLNSNSGNDNVIYGKGNEVVGKNNQIGTGLAEGPTSKDFQYPSVNKGFTLKLSQPVIPKIALTSTQLPQINPRLPDLSFSLPKNNIQIVSSPNVNSYNTGSNSGQYYQLIVPPSSNSNKNSQIPSNQNYIMVSSSLSTPSPSPSPVSLPSNTQYIKLPDGTLALLVTEPSQTTTSTPSTISYQPNSIIESRPPIQSNSNYVVEPSSYERGYTISTSPSYQFGPLKLVG